MKPRIFISAVTKELKTARQLVANTLLALGFEPVWQDIFETHSGDIRPMLREKLDTCSAVLQIVGDAYGAEPPAPDDQFGRVSYTQYEALYARSRGKKVYYLVAQADLPRDIPPDQLDLPREDSDTSRTDSAERKKLQQAYRSGINSAEHIFYPVQTHPEAELTVRRLRDDFDRLRRGFRMWLVGVSAAIILLVFLTSGGIWWLLRGQQIQSEHLTELRQQAENPDRIRAQLERTIEMSYQRAIEEAASLTDWRSRSEAKSAAEEHRDNNVARIEEFLASIQRTVQSGNASPEYIELIRIIEEQGAEEAIGYLAAHKDQLLARSRQARESDRKVNLLPILESIRQEVLLGRYDDAHKNCDALLAEDPNWGDAIHEQCAILQELIVTAMRRHAHARAEELLDESFAIAQRGSKLSKAHAFAKHDLATWYRLRGNLYRQKGESELARPDYERSAKLYEEIVQQNPLDKRAQTEACHAKQNLANVLSTQGDTQAAIELYQACLVTRQAMVATDPNDHNLQVFLASAQTNLANALAAQGKSVEAITLLRMSLAVSEKLAAIDPANSKFQDGLATVQNNLSNLLNDQDKANEALRLRQQSLAIREKLATSNPTDIEFQIRLTGAQNNLANTLANQGRAKEALDLRLQRLAIFEQIAALYPGNQQSQKVAGDELFVLSNRLADQQRLEEAFSLRKRCLAVRENLSSTNSSDFPLQRDLGSALFNLAHLAAILGQEQVAQDHYQRCVDVRAKVAESEPKNVLFQQELVNAQNNLAVILKKRGELASAAELYRRMLIIRETLVAATPTDKAAQIALGSELFSLSNLLADQKKLDEAFALRKRCLAVREKLVAEHGDDAKLQRDLGWALFNLAHLAAILGQDQFAVDHYSRCVEVRSRVAQASPMDETLQRELAAAKNNLTILMAKTSGKK